jgi:acylphosphatase
METQRAATERDVTGWVKNLPDGRVEAVFEGDAAAVKSMIKWCETGPPLARVDRTVLDWETGSGDFNAFRIAY